MNKKQKIVLCIGIVVIVLMGLFPPSNTSMSYLFRLEGPGSEYSFLLVMSPSDIGFGKLFIQWVIVAVITGGFIVTLKDKKTKRQKISKNNS